MHKGRTRRESTKARASLGKVASSGAKTRSRPCARAVRRAWVAAGEARDGRDSATMAARSFLGRRATTARDAGCATVARRAACSCWAGFLDRVVSGRGRWRCEMGGVGRRNECVRGRAHRRRQGRGWGPSISCGAAASFAIEEQSRSFAREQPSLDRLWSVGAWVKVMGRHESFRKTRGQGST